MTAANAGGRRTYRVYRYKRGEPGWRFDLFDVPLTRTVLEGSGGSSSTSTGPHDQALMHARVVRDLRRPGERPRLACVTPADDPEPRSRSSRSRTSRS